MLLTRSNRVGESLLRTGHCLTSYDELGIKPNPLLVAEVIKTAPEDLQLRPLLDEGEMPREGRALSSACRNAARRLMTPIVEVLFEGETPELLRARREWFIFGINCYQKGWTFPRHRDLNLPTEITVAIASLSGVRQLTVWDNQGHSYPYSLTRNDLMLLDGHTNPEHMAVCTEGPSISVVADIPELIRPAA